jgi:hypothetical protein
MHPERAATEHHQWAVELPPVPRLRRLRAPHSQANSKLGSPEPALAVGPADEHFAVRDESHVNEDLPLATERNSTAATGAPLSVGAAALGIQAVIDPLAPGKVRRRTCGQARVPGRGGICTSADRAQLRVGTNGAVFTTTEEALSAQAVTGPLALHNVPQGTCFLAFGVCGLT